MLGLFIALFIKLGSCDNKTNESSVRDEHEKD